MEDNSKSPESDFSGNIAGEIRSLLAVSDDEDGGEWLSEVPIKEERVEELMQELLKEMNKSSPSSHHRRTILRGYFRHLTLSEATKRVVGPHFQTLLPRGWPAWRATWKAASACMALRVPEMGLRWWREVEVGSFWGGENGRL
ncbi:hypothetical protein Acr_25g0006320 [Actinidia rufa]|uniref:Uncharacterized protein n=1 Tax=Actinidia rufa TaxID=165716 RepID=A0A7J0GZH3_9ERIC|nr:hypothetical protein Acr_25g0006320 [Actinidia rufa]